MGLGSPEGLWGDTCALTYGIIIKERLHGCCASNGRVASLGGGAYRGAKPSMDAWRRWEEGLESKAGVSTAWRGGDPAIDCDSEKGIVGIGRAALMWHTQLVVRA